MQLAPSSTRVQLARAALETALHTTQVAGGLCGPLSQFATADGDELLRGVLATARADGRYDVELHLVARWPVPPLHELGGQVERRVRHAVRRKGLSEGLGDLLVAFGDLVEHDDPVER